MEKKKNKSGNIGSFLRKYTTDVSSGGVKYSTVKTGEKKKFPIYTAACAILITAMLMFIVFSFVQVAQLRSDINRINSDISEMEKEISSRERDIDAKYKDVDFVYPMHLNPNVRKSIHEVFGENLKRPNFFFIEPLQYIEFVYLMEKSYFCIAKSV